MSRILCISHSSLNAGAERAFYEMVKAISCAGYEVHCFFPSSGPLIEYCQPYLKSYSIVATPWWFGFKLSVAGRIKLILKILLSAFKMKRKILIIKPQHVIVNTIAIPAAAIAAKLAGKPLLWFLHETANDGFSLIFGERFSKKLVGFISDKVICNSKYILKHYSTYIKEEKLFLAYQSCDIKAIERKRESTQTVFGLVGRISEQKGQVNAINAMKKMPDNARLMLIGADNNSYGDQLKGYVHEQNLSGKVIFTGEAVNIEGIYSQPDIIVACGSNEAFGRTIIEAMKCGLPVVVPDKFGYSEIVKDNETGLVYEFNNADALAEKMIVLLNKDLRIRLGENAKKWASEHFNNNSFSEALDNIIRFR